MNASILLTGAHTTTNGTIAAATREPGEPNGGDASVWYTWTAPFSGEAHWVTTGPGLCVYTGDTVSNLTLMAQATLVWNSSPTEVADFYAVAGTTYKLGLYSGLSASGDFGLSVDVNPLPVNDNFTNRIVLTGYSAQSSSSNNLATVEPGEPSVAGYRESSVWWSWTPPASGLATVTVNSDTVFHEPFGVFTGTNVSQLTLVTNNWTLDGALLTQQFPVSADTEYQIVVEGFYGIVGQIEISVGLDASAANVLRKPEAIVR